MKTVLLVDDDPFLVEVYRRPLEQHGYQVKVANDGLDAMRMLLPLRPDVVVLDLLMPKMNGNDVLKFIRGRPELKAAKIVILSDASLADAANPARALAPDIMFLKAECTPSLLLETVAMLLGQEEPPAPSPTA